MRAIGLILAAWAACAQTPVRTLFITGETDLPYHNWRETTPYLREMLASSGKFSVKVAEEPRGLDLAALAGYDLLILNYNGPRWGGNAEQAVEEFVRRGGGLLSFHQASYGEFFGMRREKGWHRGPDAGWRGFAELLGATWQPEKIGHAPRGVFTVKWVDADHPISRGLPPEFVANDELYHRLDLRSGTQVLATAYDDPSRGGTGKDEPVVWAVSAGCGRTVHLTLGHDTSAMHQGGFQSAFLRAAEWAARGEVTPPVTQQKRVRVLVVTGGHDYPSAFYTLFEGWPDLLWRHATSPAQAFRPNLKERFDVVVLHDMHEDLAERERASLRQFVESGKGVVAIHHAIVDYTAWPWWHETVIGGKYFTKSAQPERQSRYLEGVDLAVTPAPGMAKHPLLRGVGPLLVHDEVYQNMWHSPEITVLMETNHPRNDRPVVYTGPYPRSVYIQLGHEEETLRHPGYRKLVHNAILYTAGRLK